MKQLAAPIYWICIILCAIPWRQLGMGEGVTPALALFAGLVFAILWRCPALTFNKKASKYLLQASVVGLGFGMNLHSALRSGAEGMTFTIISVIGVMFLGVALAAWMHINRKTGYLISSGTAICGGSAIAAVGPVMRADSHQMAVSLGVIFVLNALALFIFPPIGHMLDMSQTQFGTWAAIAIHDTSSVVGAGEIYGSQALEVATMVKLTRALWIIPLALVTMAVFRERGQRVTIPWFIFLFVIAMAANTYLAIPEWLTGALTVAAKRGMVVTLFLIGAGLSPAAIRAVGVKPLLLAFALWVIIGVSSAIVVLSTLQ